MCDVVDISDDEGSFLLENDAGIIPKDENLDYDLPSMPREEDVASSSGTNLRSSFIGMGFAPALVDKAIKEKGEGNSELILEALFSYSDLRKSGSSDSLDGLFGEDMKENAYVGIDIPVKVEFDVGDSVIEEKTTSLLKMNFSLDEVGFAMQRLGKNAAIGKLMDFIFAARMARKYEKDTYNPIPRNEETEKDCINEVLFGIMEKSLQLLEMGFTENDISGAFERCGSEAPVTLLAESIVTGGTCPLPDKYNSSVQRSLKRKMEDCDSICIKTEECSSDTASRVGTSDLLDKLKGKKLKGKMPEVDIDDEPNNFKKPKDEFMEDSGSAVDRMLLEAGIGKYSSVNNPAPVLPRRAGRFTSFVEDRKPPISSLNPCRSLTRVVAKPPYFLYGNVTSLSHDSWGKISQFLYSVQPEFVDSQLFSALNRKEGYVHNLPTEDRFHIMPRGPTTLPEAIPYAKKWWPSWDTRKQLSTISCESTGLPYLCEKLGRMLSDCNGLPSADSQTKILQQCQAKNLVWVGKHRLSPLEPEHLEQIMGYPQHHSRIAGYTPAERLQSLKLSFQTDTLGYHLSVLKLKYPGGVSVLSFFSGIGGAEVALHRLGIRLKGVVSVEVCETKRRMMKKWWESSAQSGELIQLESISKLSSSKLEEVMKKMKGFDLVVCQNPYSVADSDSLSGIDFSMFVEFVRILQRVRSTMDRYR
ncbi:DNA (cytosine-5-)-methyltransferase, variant 2 [Salvia divinorum]|uniref:DNA (Cytosine-5-)-methyltransferase, variant 2 n=1 Tax=Salvia divinorum TaxID=28513 RepID=A0ABD1GVS0_SALDI